MKFKIKYYIILLASIILRIGYIFPVKKNRILLSSDEGLRYSCNPKYIFEKLQHKYGNKFEYIWVLNKPNQIPNRFRKNIKTTKFLSPKHIYYLLTSEFIISNLGIEPFLPKRKSQKVISTGHGGGSYKHMYMKEHMLSAAEWKYITRIRDIRGRMTDFALSSCAKQTQELSVDFGVDSKKFLQSGFPRNDRFFSTTDKSKEQALKNFCSQYNIPAENLLVLYAPTFRGTHRYQQPIDNDICIKPVASAIYNRFGKEVTFLYRRHRHSIHGNDNSKLHIVDVTDYPDMQDLLEFADIMITDYSSSIWDFCITRKPAFLYVPDLQKFMEERGFYTPIDLWPYPYSTTIDGLCQLINNYSEENSRNRIIAHQKAVKTYETGSSATIVTDLINNVSTGTCIK
ncbi:CDP-glycerol glycerophosphotransferase family protein [uncultured Muribaculum sp.]|uniref:CDP-glycerol glycerophosphotransferase family protein n=1 Tax=uncultured Muribaculum sp. TaxID=1918613 RepID=UPI00266F38C8|nr:CDP-glycerol glycerophosphotransferase family protein [uncultured Muribaculum sp.]